MEEKVTNTNKDRLFCFIFGNENNKKWTLSLYNAVNGTNYDNPDDVEITTMKDVIYMGMKNDVSFILSSEISLYEHQSTYNPNMPVRQLMYLARQYDKYIKHTDQNIYGSSKMKLPVPRLVVFYNGQDDKDDRILKLSDLFMDGVDPSRSDVEVTVHMYNIRPMYNSELLKDCKILAEYSWFVEEVRKNCKTMDTALAVDKAISDMPEDFEIKKFLMEHRAEVKNMSITEYDEAKTIELFQKEARAEGREEGLAQGRALEIKEKITDMLRRGKTVEEIVDFCGYPYDQVKKIEESVKISSH